MWNRLVSAEIGSSARIRPRSRPLVVDLADPVARDRNLTGGKAAALASAAAAGLPTLPGVVLTTGFCELVDAGTELVVYPALVHAFRSAGGHHQALVARSSSPVEDGESSSLAGQLESVIGIEGIDELRSGVRTVLASRCRAPEPTEPIAVLVQPLVEPVIAGVAFGIDPVTGRSDQRVISAVRGRPGSLVSGEVTGSRYLLGRTGKIDHVDLGDGPRVRRSVLRRILALGEAAADLFGGPQDIEWALDRQSRLWLLQSRPVTSADRGTPTGPVYGPGPVAETFPEPLTELERDLWVPPLKEAVTQVVLLTGSASARDVARSGVVIAPGGRVAIDLRLAGEVPAAAGLAHRINPLPGLRKVRHSWGMGRLRAALPRLAERLADQTDADLGAVPPLGSLTNRQLIALLHRGRALLRSLHAHEMLMGALTDVGGGRLTGASVALRVLAEARADGLPDDVILQQSPVVLALTAPAVRHDTALPSSPTAPDLGQTCQTPSDAGVIREALRLRARWVHEVTGRAAWLIGERLAASGELPSAEAVRHLSLADLEGIVTKRSSPLAPVIAAHDHPASEALPTRFQMSDRGAPIKVRRSSELGGGTGAGGGTGRGPVTFDLADPPAGSVLVTATLAPGLGPVLPRLGGIVAETGSVLSHLAILARELAVPVVVGYVDATSSFDEGQVVTVDGESGDVILEAAP